MTVMCNAVGCAAHRARSQFMCRPHWAALPQPLKSRINQTWRAFRARDPGSHAEILDYTEACDEAKRWTAEGEGRGHLFVPELPRLERLYEARTARARA